MSIEVEVENRINLNNLSRDEKKLLMQSTYTNKSYFQDLFSQDSVEFSCTDFAISFRNKIVQNLVEKNIIKQEVPLENLHEYLSEEMRAYGFDDGVNKVSTYFYEMNNEFMDIYHRFIQHIRTNWVKEPFWFQAIPTIRIHCPNSINSHHYPRYHSDIGYGHPPQEFNFWLPLTERQSGHGFTLLSLADSQTILKKFNYDFPDFIHSAIHDKDFSNYCESLAKPVETPLGNIIAFDSRCVHTGEPLKFHTRVSMDIRILPLSQYSSMTIEFQGSGRRKILFKPGHCYHAKHSDQL